MKGIRRFLVGGGCNLCYSSLSLEDVKPLHHPVMQFAAAEVAQLCLELK